MATVKQGQVVAVHQETPTSRWVEIEVAEPLGFVGGQYLIFDSGKIRENGKPGKRAYTMLSADRNQRRLEFVSQKLPKGLCSGYMNDLNVGDPVRFSGPWGKFKWPEADKFQSTDPTSRESTLVVATDTGITAALGLLGSERVGSSLGKIHLLWLRCEPHNFVSDEFVRDRLPAGLWGHTFLDCPAVGSPERLEYARVILTEVLPHTEPKRAYLCGDGVLTHGLMKELESRGVQVGREQLESFFNSSKKS